MRLPSHSGTYFCVNRHRWEMGAIMKRETGIQKASRVATFHKRSIAISARTPLEKISA